MESEMSFLFLEGASQTAWKGKAAYDHAKRFCRQFHCGNTLKIFSVMKLERRRKGPLVVGQSWPNKGIHQSSWSRRQRQPHTTNVAQDILIGQNSLVSFVPARSSPWIGSTERIAITIVANGEGKRGRAGIIQDRPYSRAKRTSWPQ
jgi:hypothetical protein